MATTPNQKPVPSEDYINMRFNAGKLDELLTSTANTYTDRLGISHMTVKGLQAQAVGALIPANNLSDVSSTATSRTNLGATATGSAVFTATTATAARTAIGAKADAGVTDASSAADGVVGQVISGTATAVAVTTATALNITSISLTAGDWDVCASVSFDTTTAPMTHVAACITPTSATLAGFPNQSQIYAAFTTSQSVMLPTPKRRINISATTTIYVVGRTAFASGTVTASAYIEARRVR